MKKFILRSLSISVILITFFLNHSKAIANFKHKCHKGLLEDYSKVSIPIRFMPGHKKCMKERHELSRWEDPNDEIYSYYYRDLTEFIINKNNKYCLWDSENWDEECQDASMEYAYGDYDEDDPESTKNYKEFKKVVINFIKYIQENDIEKAVTFTHKEAMFFSDDTNNCLVQEKNSSRICRSYFTHNKEDPDRYGKINLELFRENLMQIDVDNLKFYLKDLTHGYVYDVFIPYEYKGIRKYFIIGFEYIGGFIVLTIDPESPRDYNADPKIYDLFIYNESRIKP